MFINSSLEPYTTPKDQKLWGEISMLILRTGEYVSKLPKSYNPSMNCHSICRALARCVPEVKVVDGLYLGMECQRNGDPDHIGIILRNCNHSWLITPDRAIIDPYPVGIIITNPILIGQKGPRTVFGHQMYFPDPRVTSKIMTRNIYRESIVLSKYMLESKRSKDL
jgi:hypothetical protein